MLVLSLLIGIALVLTPLSLFWLKRGQRRDGVLLLIMTWGLVLYCVPPARREWGGGRLTYCKSELKRIGTAMEKYSTDSRGKYPTSAQQLTPNYLKTLPGCPDSGDPYKIEFGESAVYNNQGYKEYYFLRCDGDTHVYVGVPPNYPQYNGAVGLIER